MAASGLLAVGVPPFPNWLIFVKGAIIFLSVVVLALAAYALSLYRSNYYYYSGGVPGYLIFLVVKTWIIYGVSIFVELKAQRLYYRIAFLIAYLLSFVFWLSGWAWAATWAGALLGLIGSNSFGGAMAGCAALGAIIWILVIINLVFFIIACTRNSASSGNAELGNAPKQNHAPAQATYAQTGQPQPQPGYTQPQQQVYPQQQPHPQQPYNT